MSNIKPGTLCVVSSQHAYTPLRGAFVIAERVAVDGENLTTSGAPKPVNIQLDGPAKHAWICRSAVTGAFLPWRVRLLNSQTGHTHTEEWQVLQRPIATKSLIPLNGEDLPAEHKPVSTERPVTTS